MIEGIVGKALKGRHDNVVLVTKAHIPMGNNPNQWDNSRRWLTRKVEYSCAACRPTTLISIKYTGYSPDTDIVETLSALNKLRGAVGRGEGSSAFGRSSRHT